MRSLFLKKQKKEEDICMYLTHPLFTHVTTPFITEKHIHLLDVYGKRFFFSLFRLQNYFLSDSKLKNSKNKMPTISITLLRKKQASMSK